MIMNGNASKCGATWCNMVQHGAKVWKRVQDGAGWCKARWCMMVKARAIPCNTMQYHLIPRNTTQTMPYHAHQALSCNTMQYRAIPRHTMPCSAIQCNARLYHTIPISSTTADGDDLMEIKADNVYLV